jgi:5-methylcytosine-specific restriction endonuclease McrA
MGYYDDWVEPNAFFRGGNQLEGGTRRVHKWNRAERRRRHGTKCPYCGRKFIGLQDHIDAKHPRGFDEN